MHFDFDGRKMHYEGEINKNGEACGQGFAYDIDKVEYSKYFGEIDDIEESQRKTIKL